MLALSRKVDEEILIGADVRLKVLKIERNRVTIGIVAPRTIEVSRGELLRPNTEETPIV